MIEIMESSDTESSWSVYSDCDCYRCQYRFSQGLSQGIEHDSFPFYSSIQQPFVYYAQCSHGHVRKKDCKKCKPNCFVRAFRWYTNEHGDKRGNKYKTYQGGKPRPCDPVPCKDPCKETCEPYRPCSGPTNLSSFATWLDSKYHEFLADVDDCDLPDSDVCGGKKPRKRTPANNMSMEFIMEPKNLSHAASECCQPTPTCSGGDGHMVKSQSATATVCLNRSGYGNQGCSKPPMEARMDPYKTNKTCQVTHTGQNAQTQYESSQPCNAICPITPRCPPRAAVTVHPTQQTQLSQSKRSSMESHKSHKRASTESQSSRKRDKSSVKCECPPDLDKDKNKQENKDIETKSVEFKQPQSVVQQQPQQPYPNSQYPCPDFLKPCPSSQQPASSLPFPCPSANEPCPGIRPCPTLHVPCPPCENSNLHVASTVQQRGNLPQFQSGSQAPYWEPNSNFQGPRPNMQNPYQDTQPFSDMQNSSVHRTHKPCPSCTRATNVSEPCPSSIETCPCRKPCPPCPKSNVCSRNIQQLQTSTNLNINSQTQYLPNPMQSEPYSNFPTNYQQQTKFDSQTRYQQQGTLQQCPQMRLESQNQYQQPDSFQQSRFGSQIRYQQQGPQSPQMIFQPQNPCQQPEGPIQQGSQFKYTDNNVDMQYYDFNSNHNACCLPNAIRREQGPGFVASSQGVRAKQCYAPGQSYSEAGYSGAETVPGLCKTCSNLPACGMNSGRRCDPCPECNCLECATYGNTRCCKIMQTLAPPPVKNVIITTTEGKCSSNCPYYATISNKGEATQTVQFSQHSCDTTAQTSTTAIQLDRSTNPEYKLFMRVVCADKL